MPVILMQSSLSRSVMARPFSSQKLLACSAHLPSLYALNQSCNWRASHSRGSPVGIDGTRLEPDPPEPAPEPAPAQEPAPPAGTPASTIQRTHTVASQSTPCAVSSAGEGKHDASTTHPARLVVDLRRRLCCHAARQLDVYRWEVRWRHSVHQGVVSAAGNITRGGACVIVRRMPTGHPTQVSNPHELTLRAGPCSRRDSGSEWA